MKEKYGIILLAVTLGGFAPEAFALTTLKQVQVAGSSQIDLLFDGKIGKKQIQAEYFNDIIQISLKDVSVYPAKISSISGGNLLKIFAYQYAPKLVRCRITVKGKADTYRGKLQVNTTGRTVTLKIDEPGFEKTDAVALPASAPARSAQAASGGAVESGATAKSGQAPAAQVARPLEADENALLDRVMNSAPVAAGQAVGQAAQGQGGQPSRATAKPRALPGFKGLMIKLGAVVGVFCLFAFLLRRYVFKRSYHEGMGHARSVGKSGNSGLVSQLGRFARDGLGILSAREKMIEVLSTHYLGPKKSIVVVKVCGRILVLGVAQDSISLITELPEEGDDLELDSKTVGAPPLKGAGATAAGPALFAELLKSESSKAPMGGGPANPSRLPAKAAPPQQSPRPTAAQGSFTAGVQLPKTGAAPGVAASAYAAQNSLGASGASGASGGQPGVRAQIRSRLEGLKPL